MLRRHGFPAWPLAVALISLANPSLNANADNAWALVEKLDSGPPSQPKSRDEAVQLARQHFASHRAAIESFLVGYPDDPRSFDAHLRLAGLMAAEGSMDQKPALVRQALQALIALEKTPGIPSNQLADAAFRRISLQMQTLEGRESEQRDVVVTAARNFANRFPSDKRAARLLVEASTICTGTPDTMRSLLNQAQSLTSEPELNARIADDLRRLGQLGKLLEITITTTDGQRIALETLRGRVVALIFWSAESPHSVLWMRGFLEQIRKLPTSDVVFIGVSLDDDKEALNTMIQALNIPWATHFDGKGWEGDLVRSLGINAIPTLWLVDKRGILRSLNAREHFNTSLRLLQRER